MTRDEVLSSDILKLRFCKDNNIPISVVSNPYFLQRLKLFDRLFGCEKKFDVFCSELGEYNNAQDYFTYYNSVKDSVINYVKEKPEYIKFNTDTICQKIDISFPNKNIYSDNLAGIPLISIDMKKANYSALKEYDANIFDNSASWEEFIGKFTNKSHIVESKYIRQVIMGTLNPGRQVSYEKYLMSALYIRLLDKINGSEIVSISADELIIKYVNNETTNEIYKFIKENSTLPLKVNVITLSKINGTDGWIRDSYNVETGESTMEFKCLDPDALIQVLRYYYDEEITDDDLTFYYKGMLARFMEPMANPFKIN